MGSITAESFLEKTGMTDFMTPGMIRYKHVKGDKEGTSYTIVWDWKTNPDKIRVEVRPGLSGKYPAKEEMKNYAVWLQTQNVLEFDLAEQAQYA